MVITFGKHREVYLTTTIGYTHSTQSRLESVFLNSKSLVWYTVNVYFNMLLKRICLIMIFVEVCFEFGTINIGIVFSRKCFKVMNMMLIIVFLCGESINVTCQKSEQVLKTETDLFLCCVMRRW